MLKGKFREIIKKIIIIVSAISFFWVSGSRVVNMITKPQTEVPSQTETKSPEQQLQEAEKGYETVLEKEPNNRFALEKLVETRLQLRDLQGALEPTEKLVELYPESQQYQQVLAIIKENIAKESQSQDNPSPPPNQAPQTP
jgi:tetratricopeptide (TPR) repeat protein